MQGRGEDASDIEILRALQSRLNNSGDPAVFTADISDKLPIGPAQTNNRLSELEEKGLVEGRRRPNVASIWWLTDEGRAYLEEASE